MAQIVENMTVEEAMRRRDNWEILKEQMPEAADFVRDLYREGLVEGLRCVNAVNPHGRLPEPANSVNAGEMNLESTAKTMARLKKQEERYRGNH